MDDCRSTHMPMEQASVSKDGIVTITWQRDGFGSFLQNNGVGFITSLPQRTAESDIHSYLSAAGKYQ